jgi:hypothetical protein
MSKNPGVRAFLPAAWFAPAVCAFADNAEAANTSISPQSPSPRAYLHDDRATERGPLSTTRFGWRQRPGFQLKYAQPLYRTAAQRGAHRRRPAALSMILRDQLHLR